MPIGIFVTARLGSSRLKRKHLLPVVDGPMILRLVNRITSAFEREIAEGEAMVVVTTTSATEDEELILVEDAGAVLFRGVKDNIPLRHLQACERLHLDAVVSVDGDDVLCDTEAMQAVYDALADGAEGAYTKGLPLGLNAWGYSARTLQNGLAGHEEDTLETGWGRIFDFDRFVEIDMPLDVPGGDDPHLRFTLDYQEDLAFFRAVIEGLWPGSDTATAEEIVEYVLDNDLAQLNRNRSIEYWNNFEAEKNKENEANSQGDGSDNA